MAAMMLMLQPKLAWQPPIESDGDSNTAHPTDESTKQESRDAELKPAIKAQSELSVAADDSAGQLSSSLAAANQETTVTVNEQQVSIGRFRVLLLVIAISCL